MNNNFKEIYLCSINKLIKSYSYKGSGEGRDLIVLSIINKVLVNIDYMLNKKEKQKLNSLITIIGNSSPSLCVEDINAEYIYGVDDCMNPTYESSYPYNNAPHVDDNTIIIN